MHILNGFSAALAGHDMDYLTRTDDVAFGLDGDDRIAMFNDANLRFCQAEGGGPSALPWLGQGYLDVVPDVLRPFYQDLFGRARSGGVHSHEYQCSSPTRFRSYRMWIHPLTDRNLLVIHRLIEDREHTQVRPDASVILARYRHEDGLIRQCAHCRAVLRVGQPPTWDWVPELLIAPDPKTSSGLCPPCVIHYMRSVRVVDTGR